MSEIQKEFIAWMKAERRVWTSMCKTNYDLDEDGRFEDSEVFMFFISYIGGKQSAEGANIGPTEETQT